MNQLYEVNAIAYSMKTFYVSAEIAEDAGRIAEVLCNNHVINLNEDMTVRVEVASVSGNEYYEGYIKDNDDCKGIPNEEMCKNCILHSIYNSIGDVSIDKV